MGDDEAPTTWWVFKSSDFLIYTENTLITKYWGSTERKEVGECRQEEGNYAYRFLLFVTLYICLKILTPKSLMDWISWFLNCVQAVCCFSVADLTQMRNIWKANRRQLAPPFLPLTAWLGDHGAVWITKPTSCFPYRTTVFLGIFVWAWSLAKMLTSIHRFNFLRFIQKEWNKLVCNYVYRQN